MKNAFTLLLLGIVLVTQGRFSTSLIASNLGDNAHNIILPNPSGQLLHLSQLKGKYVLLHFWASWCPYSSAQLNNYTMIYDKYHQAAFSDANGFDIFSVSLDRNSYDWQQGIKDYNMRWNNHVSTLNEFDNPALDDYKVEHVPTAYLIDPNGIIIAYNPTLPVLDAILSNRSNLPGPPPDEFVQKANSCSLIGSSSRGYLPVPPPINMPQNRLAGATNLPVNTAQTVAQPVLNQLSGEPSSYDNGGMQFMSVTSEPVYASTGTGRSICLSGNASCSALAGGGTCNGHSCSASLPPGATAKTVFANTCVTGNASCSAIAAGSTCNGSSCSAPHYHSPDDYVANAGLPSISTSTTVNKLAIDANTLSFANNSFTPPPAFRSPAPPAPAPSHQEDLTMVADVSNINFDDFIVLKPQRYNAPATTGNANNSVVDYQKIVIGEFYSLAMGQLDNLSDLGTVEIQRTGNGLMKVLLGAFSNNIQTLQVLQNVKKRGYDAAYVANFKDGVRIQ